MSHGENVFGPLSSTPCLRCRFRKKLLEVFKKIRCSVEECCDLCVNVLDRLLLPLIGLQNLQKLFVDFWLVLKAVLWLEKVSKVPFLKVYK